MVAVGLNEPKPTVERALRTRTSAYLPIALSLVVVFGGGCSGDLLPGRGIGSAQYGRPIPGDDTQNRFTVLAENSWDEIKGGAWGYSRRTASLDSDIVSDPTAPFSPLNVLRIRYTSDMQRDTEPGVHWVGLPNVKEIYTAWWMKVSANWKCSPAGCGKVTFLFGEAGHGQVYTGIYHPCSGPEVCGPPVEGPPFKFAANTEWEPYGQKVWYPNVHTTMVNADQWVFVEFYYKWSSSPEVPDGIIRFWVDGVLNGDHRDVLFPPSHFIELQYAPTTQDVLPEEQHMYVDDTVVSQPAASK